MTVYYSTQIDEMPMNGGFQIELPMCEVANQEQLLIFFLECLLDANRHGWLSPQGS